jgi:hypothetical protein
MFIVLFNKSFIINILVFISILIGQQIQIDEMKHE